MVLKNCGHTFCVSCVEVFRSRARGKNDVFFPCPICNKPTDSVSADGAVPNFTLLEMISRQAPVLASVPAPVYTPPPMKTSPEPTFPVFFVTLDGQMHQVNGLRHSDSVALLKAKVCMFTGMSLAQIMIIFKGKGLDDTRSLLECGLGPGATVNVVTRLRGGW